MSQPLRALVLCAMTLGFAVTATAENWPHWRGPRFDGTSQATGLPSSWDAETNVRWRLELPGHAASTPVVWGERIFLTSTVEGSEDLVVMAVDEAGKPQWRTTVSSGAYDFQGGLAQFAHETNPASPSPVTDGEHIWVMYGNGTLAAVDLDGKVAWKVNLEERYGALSLYFGLSSSPFVDGDKLFLQLLNTNGQWVVALDKKTGKEAWKHERKTDATDECLHSYTSPFTYPAGDQRLLVIHGADYVSAHRLSDGAEQWRHGGLNPKDGYNPSFRLVATPIFTDGLMVVPSAKRGPVYGIDPKGAKGDVTGKATWHLERGTPDVPSPVVHDGLVYLSGERGTLTSLDAKTGEKVYDERVHGAPHRGSPVVADGKVFLMSSDGTVSVIKAGKTYELLAQNTFEERMAASPAFLGDTILLRTHKALYAVGETAKPEAAAGN
ncbi:MAG: PQQ-binding-like beta-propeller repeat protein [Acidobacteriota bacterium]